jgi:hypothetical protein
MVYLLLGFNVKTEKTEHGMNIVNHFPVAVFKEHLWCSLQSSFSPVENKDSYKVKVRTEKVNLH